MVFWLLLLPCGERLAVEGILFHGEGLSLVGFTQGTLPGQAQVDLGSLAEELLASGEFSPQHLGV